MNNICLSKFTWTTFTFFISQPRMSLPPEDMLTDAEIANEIRQLQEVAAQF